MLGLDSLRAEIAAQNPVKWVGRVREIDRGTLVVSGLSRVAGLGDLVEIEVSSAPNIRGEILSLTENNVIILPDGMVQGLQVGQRVFHLGQDLIAPDESWLGKVIDPYCRSIDGDPLLRGANPIPLAGPPPAGEMRRGLGPRLATGLAVFNTLLPIVRGQRIGLFAGSGVGKSTLLGKLATTVETDVVVLALIGERGREVREFVEKILGPVGMARSIVVAATSDQSALTRRRCAQTAMAIAEHFRDRGNHVLLVMDSVTRFAQAHREVALSMGEAPSLGGYPPSMAQAVTELCERAGPGGRSGGDITAIFSVLVAGSDMEEPVADTLRGVLDGHVVLERTIAERGRFPAIDVLRSVSRALPEAAGPQENALIGRARAILSTYEQNETMVRAGLYSPGSNQDIDIAIDVWPRLDTFVGASENVGVAESFEKLAKCWPVPSEEVGPPQS